MTRLFATSYRRSCDIKLFEIFDQISTSVRRRELRVRFKVGRSFRPTLSVVVTMLGRHKLFGNLEQLSTWQGCLRLVEYFCQFLRRSDVESCPKCLIDSRRPKNVKSWSKSSPSLQLCKYRHTFGKLVTCNITTTAMQCKDKKAKATRSLIYNVEWQGPSSYQNLYSWKLCHTVKSGI